jgi:ubiquinone/menaquinone biosynthesis C-methylase UbiE
MSDGAAFRDHEGRVVDFGRTAADYEKHRPGFPRSLFDRLLQSEWIAAGQRVLDLGTGTGSLALGFAARGLEVTGLDISSELLQVARQAAVDRELSARFIEARAEATGQVDASYDLVSAGQCWWWFDSDAAIREAGRILVPGGRLLICNFSYLPMPGNVAGRTEDLILEHNPGWPRAGWRGVHPEQVQALDEGGFQEIESFSYVTGVPFSHESWRGRIRTCNGVGSALSDEQVERFDTDLTELLDREFPGELRVPHRVFVTSGINP